MSYYNFDLEDRSFGDGSSMNINDAFRELDFIDAPEPVTVFMDEIVDKFVEYRKQAVKRGVGLKSKGRDNLE